MRSEAGWMKAVALLTASMMFVQAAVTTPGIFWAFRIPAQQPGVPMYTQQPGPIWRGERPGRESETRGGFYTQRTNDAIDEAARRWQREGGGGLVAGDSPIVPGGLASGGGGGIPGEATFAGMATGGGIINTWNGNMMKVYGLAGWPTRGSLDFAFTLHHNSISDYDVEFGHGWSFSFGAKLHVEPNGTVIIRWGDGTVVGYTPNGSGGYIRPPGIFDELTVLAGGNFKITAHDQTVYEFTPPNGSLINDLGDLIAIRDRNSNQITITISTSQTPGTERATRVTDCVTSRYIDLTYNSTSAMVEEIEDHTGRVWSFDYFGLLSNDLEDITYPLLGADLYSRVFEYDNHRIITETDLRGYDWTYTYQPTGTRITSSANPLGKTTSYSYTLTATTITHPDLETNIHNYSGGLIASAVDEAGFSVTYKIYNSDRLVTQFVDARSKPYNYTYDTRGNLRTATDPLSHVTTYTYQTTNELVTAKNHLNEEWEYTYYSDGNLKETWDPENRRLAYFHYDTAGQLDWVKDANNEQTSVIYGSDGYPNTVTDPLSNTSVIELDSLGRVIWVEDPIQAATGGTDDRTDIAYDDWGRQEVVTHPPKTPLDPRHTTQFSYDEEGGLLMVIDERGKTVSYTYNTAGQLTDTFNQKNENEHLTYNDRGWVTHLRNGRLKTREYFYTDRGEVWGVHLPDATQESWSRDGNGNITQHAYEKVSNPYQSERKNYTYDNANRLTLIDYLGAMTNVSFGYDNADRQTSMVDATGTSSWEYWLDGQVKKFISPQGTMRYDFNANARLQHIYEEFPGQADLVTTYSYDDASRVQSVNKFGETTSFQYDAAWRPERMTYGNATYTKYVYDGRARIISVEHYTSANSLLRKETNVFDPASRITSRYEGPATGGITTTFGYDDVGQLTSESFTGHSATYTYDANGNRATKVLGGVTETYTVDDADKLLSVTYSDLTPAKTYAYHYSGRCTGITQNGVTKTLAWNKESRMTGMTAPGINYSYGYNGVNTRISKTDGTGSFVFKRVDAHQTGVVLSDGSASYLPGISEKRSGVSTFLHTGLKYGVLQTSSTQSNTATRRYDAFGNVLSTSGTWLGPFGYGGKFGYQTDSGSIELLGDRYYDSSIGRFLSRDAAKDGRNWYAYCANNPISGVDPTGRAVDIVIDVAGAILSLADFIADPSLENGAWLLLDGVAVAIPFIPGTKAARLAGDLLHGGEAVAAGRRLATGSDACFVADTQVAMADGTTKPIEDIDVGDVVLTRDETAAADSTPSVGVVSQTFSRRSKAMLLLTFSDGSSVETTNEHPFHVEGRGFVAADTLKTSYRLSQDDGERKLIARVTPLQRSTTVYNLEIVGSHTYFVGAGDDLVWVHNKCKMAGVYIGTGNAERGGLPYVGGTMNETGRIAPNHHALDPNKPVIFFEMPGASWDEVRAAEQNIINLIGRGNLNNLANKRNAIAKKNWTKFGVTPPGHLD